MERLTGNPALWVVFIILAVVGIFLAYQLLKPKRSPTEEIFLENEEELHEQHVETIGHVVMPDENDKPAHDMFSEKEPSVPADDFVVFTMKDAPVDDKPQRRAKVYTATNYGSGDGSATYV